MSLNQRVGYVFGAVYIVVGLIGFAVTGGIGFADPEGGQLLGLFEVNPLPNIVHLLVGVALVGAAAADAAVSKGANIVIGAVFAVLGVVGFFVPGDSAMNILALNVVDHFLHLGSAALLLGVGLYEREPVRTETPARV